jgi:hypothetical protein
MAQAQLMKSINCPICLELFGDCEKMKQHFLTTHFENIEQTDSNDELVFNLNIKLCRDCVIRSRFLLESAKGFVILTLCERCAFLNRNLAPVISYYGS